DYYCQSTDDNYNVLF
nr:immunoglobulin light chain junction region [Macaca mulatta]MOX69590.1 immunoglobulin light chain junction region [Macaca mulatta]MOX69718.1 immunoglobulin light chain junction region [Macaca mulatta]MOX70125.1 immunoglobulin light chain junction region [Macaca mulatta]MOX70481.1 immunoglobulin light chain junction region [Macaca mulatta]